MRRSPSIGAPRSWRTKADQACLRVAVLPESEDRTGVARERGGKASHSRADSSGNSVPNQEQEAEQPDSSHMLMNICGGGLQPQAGEKGPSCGHVSAVAPVTDGASDAPGAWLLRCTYTGSTHG